MIEGQKLCMQLQLPHPSGAFRQRTVPAGRRFNGSALVIDWKIMILIQAIAFNSYSQTLGMSQVHA